VDAPLSREGLAIEVIVCSFQRALVESAMIMAIASREIVELRIPVDAERPIRHGTPWQFSETQAQIGIAPELGVDNEQVLGELGYSTAEISGLRERKII
jgi:crotonobetainyl-CoA:carnitine CoA-transferase CaiB-like acyl-CoA transferase